MRPSSCSRAVAVFLNLALVASTGAVGPPPAPRVTPVPGPLRKALKLDPFYQKYTDYQGLPILSSRKVSDAGLLEARHLISRMLSGRDDITRAMVKARARFVVM